MKTHLYLIHALSPLHAGTGQSVGAIDLPIAREKPTGIPLVPGSSVKGALRALCRTECKDEAMCDAIFGTKTGADNEAAGAVQFSDAHLLLLPVRSIAGTFAWVTSPFLIQRFARDAKEAGKTIKVPKQPEKPEYCFTGKDRKIVTNVNAQERVLLEDFDFQPFKDQQKVIEGLADFLAPILFTADDEKQWQTTLKERLCVVHDDVMALLLETATEVVARIKLDEDTKTVSKGALWYEEALPVESVLYGLVVASKVNAKEGTKRQAKSAEELLEEVGNISRGMVQLGGKATVGRGVCHVRLHGGA
jgi:CRISPR-associated protein Cmr4